MAQISLPALPTILAMRYQVEETLLGEMPAYLAKETYGEAKVVITPIVLTEQPDFSLQTKFSDICWQCRSTTPIGEAKLLDVSDDYYGSPKAIYIVQQYLAEQPELRSNTVIKAALELFLGGKEPKTPIESVGVAAPQPVGAWGNETEAAGYNFDLLTSSQEPREQSLAVDQASSSSTAPGVITTQKNEEIENVQNQANGIEQTLPDSDKNDEATADSSASINPKPQAPFFDEADDFKPQEVLPIFLYEEILPERLNDLCDENIINEEVRERLHQSNEAKMFMGWLRNSPRCQSLSYLDKIYQANNDCDQIMAIIRGWQNNHQDYCDLYQRDREAACRSFYEEGPANIADEKPPMGCGKVILGLIIGLLLVLMTALSDT